MCFISFSGAFWKFHSSFVAKPVLFFVFVFVFVVFFFYCIYFFSNFTFFRRKLKVFIDLLEMYKAVQNGKIKYWTSWTQKTSNESIRISDWFFNKIPDLYQTAMNVTLHILVHQNIITSKQDVYLIFHSKLMKNTTAPGAYWWSAIHYITFIDICVLRALENGSLGVISIARNSITHNLDFMLSTNCGYTDFQPCWFQSRKNF